MSQKPEYFKGFFIKRLNRFKILLLYNNQKIECYLPNTGRMEELLIPGHPFYFIKYNEEFKVTGTEYQGSFVFLDTISLNKIIKRFILNGKFKEFKDIVEIKSEYKFMNSRFDFYIETRRSKFLLEIKSCTLCHNKIAMFPDAPTLRGIKHIFTLQKSISAGYKPVLYFIITNYNAETFIPNYHTHFEYCKTLMNSRGIKIESYKIKFLNPVEVDINSLKKVKIDFQKVKQNCVDKGSYVLILENKNNFTMKIGKIGNILFKKGYYLYTGSALNSLEKRIKRHFSRNKKIFWHIDYIVPYKMKIKKVYLIRHNKEIRKEEELASKFLKISDSYIKGFGATDSKIISHLFYFKENPLKNYNVIKTILDAQV